MTVTSIEEELADLDGLITPEIGGVLYGYARATNPYRSIVELGSYRGASTCWLAAGRRDTALAAGTVDFPPVYAVDAWNPDVTAWSRYIRPATIGEFNSQLLRHELLIYVSPQRGLTTEVAATFTGAPIGLLYIDADHSEEAALADFLAWQRHLCDGATVIFDDYQTRQNPGVEAAVRRLTDDGWFSDVKLLAGRLAVATLGVSAVTE